MKKFISGFIRRKIRFAFFAFIEPYVDERVSHVLLKNRLLQERLKTRLESIGLESKLFGDAPACRKRYDLFPIAFDFARRGGDGLWLEFGVYKGKTINFTARHAPGVVYGFDSFEGLPANWTQGLYRTAHQGKRHLRGNLPQVEKNVRLIKGLFQDTLRGFVKEHPEAVAFVHVDSDLYESASYVLENLRFQEGSVIVFDEYFNYPSWQEGEYKAFQEFLAKRNAKATCIGYCPTSNQAAFVLTDLPGAP